MLAKSVAAACKNRHYENLLAPSFIFGKGFVMVAIKHFAFEEFPETLSRVGFE
jgi:hypothetical protein